jgi:hypothetical protein
MAWRTVVGTARIAAATAGLVALIARFSYALSFRSFAGGDYFAYLTVQSNLAAVAIHLLAGIAILRGRAEPRLMTTGRCLVTCFVLVAGIVFALLVGGAPAQGYRLDVPWSDQVLHFYLPAYALLDWLVAPGRRRVSWRALPWAVGYPVVWGVLTIIRGRVVGWYPYFFLDPAQSGYPLSFVAYSAAALALFAAVAAGLIASSRTRPLADRATDAAPADPPGAAVPAAADATHPSSRPSQPSAQDSQDAPVSAPESGTA